MSNFWSMSTLLLALGNFMTIYLYRHMHRTFYKRKAWTEKEEAWYALVYLCDYVLVFMANMMEFPPLNLAAMILSYLLPLFICYKIESYRGLAYFVFYLVASLAIEVTMGASMGYLQNNMGFQTRYDVITPPIALIMNMAEIVIVLAICRFGNKEDNARFNGLTLRFALIPLASVCLIAVDIFRLAKGDAVGFNSDQFLHTIILLMVINIVLFVILEKYTERVKRELQLTADKLKAESDADLMNMAAKSMKERLMIAEQVVQQDRMMRHDRRHFEALMLSLLSEGKVDEVQRCLEERLAAEPRTEVKYCDNAAVNAAIRHYIAWAEKEDIKVSVAANIPSGIQVDDMELAITISNLLENAIHACQAMTEGERYIRLSARYKQQLLLEIENSCASKVSLDEEGHPDTSQADHGIGTRSVLAFAGKNGGEVYYTAEEHRFKVRMIVG